MKKLIALIVAILLPLSCYAQTNWCGPVLKGAKLFFPFECNNDMTFMVTNPAISGTPAWQYTFDMGRDDTGGSEYQIFGMALFETNDEIWIALSSNMPRGGVPFSSAQNGTITYGDLFIDLYGPDFKSASDHKKLFAVHYMDNDSDVSRLGVYKNVRAKNVTQLNNGFDSLEHYESAVMSGGNTPSYGDLTITQAHAYYLSASTLNEIAGACSGYAGPTYLGPITSVTPAELAAAGYDSTKLGGSVTVAFKFQKDLIIDQCGVIGGDGKSCLDCAGVACGVSVKDICGVCGGNGTSCLGCDNVPNSGTTLDLCGVCGGDNSTCKDCAGVPNGGARLDLCGVCGGDNSTCKDCKGVPNGGATIDVCGVCGGDGLSCLGCDALPNSGKVIDACGICGGDSTSCLDCTGIPNGGAKIDQCGVCNGNNSSCLDCKGVPNGHAVVDACGVCDGGITNPSQCLNTQCANGGKIDKCGVCGGADACLDCAGVPNGGAKIDCCGICGGDGSACLAQCKFYDLTKAKRTARSAMKKLLASVTKYSKGELACSKGKSKKAKARISLAKKLYVQNLDILATFIQTKIKLCDTPFCSKTSLISMTQTVKLNNRTLYKLSRDAQHAAGVACNAPRRTGHAPAGSSHGDLGKANSAVNEVPPQACNN